MTTKELRNPSSAEDVADQGAFDARSSSVYRDDIGPLFGVVARMTEAFPQDAAFRRHWSRAVSVALEQRQGP